MLDAQGQRLGRHEVAHTRAALERFVREILRPDDAVALEGTTNTWAVVAVPRPNVGRAAVGNAMKIRATLVCDRSRVKFRIQSLPDSTAPGSGRAFRARRRPSRPLTRLRTG